MTKENREGFYIAATVGAVVLLWWAWNKNNPVIPAAAGPSDSTFPVPWGQPMDSVYNANPTAYEPPTNKDLTLNIDNPYLSMLNSAYMPLFGFVGIAQGIQL